MEEARSGPVHCLYATGEAATGNEHTWDDTRSMQNLEAWHLGHAEVLELSKTASSNAAEPRSASFHAT